MGCGKSADAKYAASSPGGGRSAGGSEDNGPGEDNGSGGNAKAKPVGKMFSRSKNDKESGRSRRGSAGQAVRDDGGGEKAQQVEREIASHRKEKRKGDDDIKLIRTALQENVVCKSLTEKELDELGATMESFAFKEGEYVCRQGDMGTHFFIILDGTFDVLVNNSVVNKMTRGKAFGELALIHNCPRSASVLATSTSSLFGVHRKTFRRILKQLSQRNYEENRKFLDSISLFDLLTDAQKKVIVEAMHAHMYQKGAIVVREGEAGDMLFILKSGVLAVTINGKEVRQLKKGDYFGERSLLYEEPRSATVTTVEACVCVSIGKSQLRDVFKVGNLEHLLFQNVIQNSLKDSSVFKDFSQQQIDSLVAATVYKDFEAGATVHGDNKHGMEGVRFFIVLSGEITISGEGISGTKKLERGGAFGDEYVQDPGKTFSNKVAVTGKEPAKLALLSSEALTQTLLSDGNSSLQEAVDWSHKSGVLRKVYIFRNTSAHQAQLLVKAFRIMPKMKAGEPVVKQGELGSTFFIIREGEVKVTLQKGSETKLLRTMGKHDYFGERALLYDEPRTANVTVSKDDTTLWAIDKQVFLQVLHESMREHLEYRVRLQDTNVVFSDLKVDRTVGKGTFGVVKLVSHKQTKTRYALKCVMKSMVLELKQEDNVKMEREILAENDHPFIIKLVRTFKDNKYCYFLTELVTGGELYDAIRKLGLLAREAAMFYLGSLVLALEYLHERTIAYRDLKPENVLLDSRGYCKLIDFGCARKLGGERSFTLVGTPHYMAPEVILGKGYTQTADIWSLGICLFEFMCGPLPFGNDADDQLEVFKEILTGQLRFPHYVSDQAAMDLMKRLLCRSPEQRIGCSIRNFQEIKEHPFYEGFTWDALLGMELKPPLIPNAETYSADTENGDDGDITEPVDVINVEWDKDFG